jgi:hypothetical protein
MAIDACFKLSMKGGGKKRSDDPELAPGHGVFVDEQAYQAVLKEHGNEEDVRHIPKLTQLQLIIL